MRASCWKFCPQHTSTLTTQLEVLARRIGGLSASNGDVSDAWTDVMKLGKTALALRESDTLLTVSNHLIDLEISRLRTGVTAPSLKLDHSTWLQLFEFAKYSDIEASSVCVYGRMFSTGGSSTGKRSTDGVDYDLLWATGGVVPVGHRITCATGAAHLELLQRWQNLESAVSTNSHHHHSVQLPEALLDGVLASLEAAKETLQHSVLEELVPVLLTLSNASETDAKIFQFVEGLPDMPRCDPEGLSDASMAFNGATPSGPVRAALSIMQRFFASTDEIRSFLAVERAFRLFNLVAKRYVDVDVTAIAQGSHPSVASEVERLANLVDMALQQNESTGNNALELEADVCSLVRRTAMECKWHCAVVEARPRVGSPASPSSSHSESSSNREDDSPDDGFGTAVDHREGSVTAGATHTYDGSVNGDVAEAMMRDLSVQGLSMTFPLMCDVVLMRAKAVTATTKALIEANDDDAAVTTQHLDEACSQLIQSLRLVVEHRPRTDLGFSDDGARAMDPETRRRYQEVHSKAIAALCDTRSERWLQEAYVIIVTHKYHQLLIDAHVVRPLLRRFARTGDGRAFNIVDLITLYSNQKIDYDTIECLFRVCNVSGDFHRAKALLQILKETVPGFLSKAPQGIIDPLRELGVLPPIPGDAFELPSEDSPAQVPSRPLVELPTVTSPRVGLSDAAPQVKHQ